MESAEFDNSFSTTDLEECEKEVSEGASPFQIGNETGVDDNLEIVTYIPVVPSSHV